MFQTCFLCKGTGQIYKFSNNIGPSSECPSCKGTKQIPLSYMKCPACDEGKIYPFPNKGGIPKNCELCNGLYYIQNKLLPCIKCNGTGKIYPFSENKGIPSNCNEVMEKDMFLQEANLKICKNVIDVEEKE